MRRQAEHRPPPLPSWAPKEVELTLSEDVWTFELDNITYSWRPLHEMWLPVIKIREKP